MEAQFLHKRFDEFWHLAQDLWLSRATRTMLAGYLVSTTGTISFPQYDSND